MAVYLIDVDSLDFDPLFAAFAFDLVRSESREDSVEWTQYAIEAGANVSDYGYTNPSVFRLSGLVTDSPIDGAYDPNRAADLDEALRELMKARQPLTLVTWNWVEDVVIASVTGTKTVQSGGTIDLEVTCQTIERPLSYTVQIPPALLRDDMKAGASSAPTGPAAASASDASESRKGASIAAAAKNGGWGGAIDEISGRFGG